MSKRNSTKNSQSYKPTRSSTKNRKHSKRTNYKSREKSKFKSGARPKNRFRDSGRDQTQRCPSNRSRKKNKSSSDRKSNYKNRNRSLGQSKRGVITFHRIICAKCNKVAEVPFKPTGKKPVYCRECFKDQNPEKGRSSSRNHYGKKQHSNRESKQLFTTTCAKCRKEAQVPFKPTGKKPVYCRDCFKDQKTFSDSLEDQKVQVVKKDETVERFGDRPGPYRAGKRMHQTICKNCNKKITVPFKPKKDKSIYCQDCFQKEKKRN